MAAQMMVIRQTLIWAIASAWSLAAYASDIDIERIPRPAHASPRLLKSLARYEASQRALLRECREDVRRSKTRDVSIGSRLSFELHYGVLWDSDRYFSVIARRNIFCDGPYIAFSEQGLTFDKVSGRKYDALRLYRLNYPKGRPFPEIRREVRELIRESLIKARGTAIKDDDCIGILKQDEISLLDEDTVALTQRGVFVAYSGPHAVQSCYEPVILEYERLRNFLDVAEAKRVGWKR
jgi:hypothetical protein